MRSIIYETDKAANADRQFGADPFYFHATFVHADGRRALLRLTEEQVQAGLDRGAHDPDGLTPRLSWGQRIREWLR